jgi:hypothetical protein
VKPHGQLVGLRSFLRVSVLGSAMLLTPAAILAKLACGLARRGSSLTVELGMLPRGAVGLILAEIACAARG